MRTSGYSSVFGLRLLLAAAMIAAVMFAGLVARAGAAGNDGQMLGMITQAVVVDESTIIVDPAPSTESGSSGVLSFEAMQFVEQNLYPAVSASEVAGPIGRLQTHGEVAIIQAPQTSSRSQFHYLEDNLDIASAASIGGTREQYHYLDDEVAIAALAPEQSADRYDRRSFLSDDYVDSNSAVASSTRRYDEIKFLEENGVAALANSPEERMAERDRIQFFEENWLYVEPESGDTAEVTDSEQVQVALQSRRDWIQFQNDNWNLTDADYPALSSAPDETGFRP
jgi:hypothetical protein